MYTAAEICHQLGRKLFNQKPPAGYKLYMKERGLGKRIIGPDICTLPTPCAHHPHLCFLSERVIAPNEKPLVFQRRRLEQAGYTMLDRLDDVGRLDYSYLMKFLYKEESLTAAATVSSHMSSTDFFFIDQSH
jgi:adenylate cyclase